MSRCPHCGQPMPQAETDEDIIRANYRCRPRAWLLAERNRLAGRLRETMEQIANPPDRWPESRIRTLPDAVEYFRERLAMVDDALAN